MQKQLLITGLITMLGVISNIFAYPISPRPLRLLVIESQHIIVGYVVKTYEKKKEENEWNTRIAKIAILESLQGNLSKDTIEIEFNPNMGCPAPDRYFDSTYVISFFDKNDQNGKFYTHALSYGAKTLDMDEIRIYKQRILEIQKILKIRNKKKQRIETVEWLVKCAENETTRWEGTFELSPQSHFMSYYYGSRNIDYKNSITVSQRERLKNVLLNNDEDIDFGIVDVVYITNEIMIEEFLLTKLKNLKEEEYWIATDLMQRLIHKNVGDEMNEILEKFEEIRFDGDNIAELEKLVKKFIDLIE